MKKLLFLIQLIAMIALSSSTTYASGGHGNGHGKGHSKHHHKHYYPQPVERVYYQPQPHYPQPVDRRSTEGLVGGALGSAVGYHVGNGNPIAAGVGAAAGAYLGNEVSGRR